MHRFYLSPEKCGGSRLVLESGEAHHALHVLRVKSGERVVVLDGAGHEFLCETLQPEKETLPLQVVQKNNLPSPPGQITLLQAVPKGKIIESIIQKATELGVSRVVPLLSNRVVAQLDDETGAARAQKWQQVAIEAVKQCGAPWLPKVEAPMTPKEYLARGEKFELPLIASLQSDARHPRTYFQTFQKENQRLPASLCIWVGPEGDFTPAEMSAVKSAGALPITLGRLVLRSETAATYCLSILNYELQAPAQL